MTIKSAVQQADENKASGICMSSKRKETPVQVGKLVYSTDAKGELHIQIVNASRGYPYEQQKDFFEMVQVLQEEGKLPSAGSIAIPTLEKM